MFGSDTILQIIGMILIAIIIPREGRIIEFILHVHNCFIGKEVIYKKIYKYMKGKRVSSLKLKLLSLYSSKEQNA